MVQEKEGQRKAVEDAQAAVQVCVCASEWISVSARIYFVRACACARLCVHVCKRITLCARTCLPHALELLWRTVATFAEWVHKMAGGDLGGC